MTTYSQAQSLVERFMVQAIKRAEECSGEYSADFLVGYLKGQLATIASASDEGMRELESMVAHMEKSQ